MKSYKIKLKDVIINIDKITIKRNNGVKTTISRYLTDTVNLYVKIQLYKQKVVNILMMIKH